MPLTGTIFKLVRMVSRFGWAPFVAFVVCAAVGSAAPAVSSVHSLAVRTWIPDVDVDGSGGLKVTTVITNTGDETLKLVNTSRGVLSPFPGDAFNITDPSGSRLLLDGASVSRAFDCRMDMCADAFGSRF